MSKIHAVGIDLGTTYSVVARLDENGKSQIVRNTHGDILTPSVVLFDDQEIIVGKEAKKAAATEPDRVAECVKRDMGNEFFSQPIRGEKLPPEVIQACILRKLAADATRACGQNIKVVITVPAYFDEPRRKATADAGEMAGLDVLDIVNEPTAAALAYGEHLGYLDPQGSPKGDIKVLVYDLGGGTFDVTVIELRPHHIRTLATDGDVRLGGRDWDARLADYLSQQFQSQYGSDPRQDPRSQIDLMRAVEDAKHTLSARASARVHVKHAGKVADLEVTREKFAELSEDLLERTAYTTRQVLQAAGTSFQYISHILLVGGSTRMPMVAELLERLAGGLKPEHVVNPDEAVARGAAIYAGYLLATRKISEEPSKTAKFTVTDVNAHSLGIEGIDQETLRKENIIVIPRNSPLPCRVEQKFVTKSSGQQSVVVQVLEGESKSPAQCTRIARAVLRQLPQGLPKGYPIDVSYAYETNGRLSVVAKLPGTNKDVRIELEREGGMDDDHVAKWKRVVAAEKGFDAFEAVLEEVLHLESLGQAPPKPAMARSAEPPFHGSSLGESATKPSLAPTKPTPPILPIMPVSKLDLEPTVQPPSRETPDFKLPDNISATSQVANPPAKPAVENSPAQSAPVLTGPHPLRRTTGPSMRSVIINLMGHVVASVLGLGVGYYILCWISPQSNFLQLSLPGLPPPAMEAPADPTTSTQP